MNSETPTTTWRDKLLVSLQYALPQLALSHLVGNLSRLPMGWLTHWLITRFVHHYKVDMSIATNPHLHEYRTFNQFFTRALRAETRPLATADILSPVDGEISQIGQIHQQQLLQAKGWYFNLNDLLAGYSDIVRFFKEGLFCTIYLAPRDYHRIHLPSAGRLTDIIYVPGKLFSVNQRTTRTVPNLFSRNERVICLFETDWGHLAVIMVGAMLVGSIETVWTGIVTRNRSVHRWHYVPEAITPLKPGIEIGRFNMGSTVILLTSKHPKLQWSPEYRTGSKLQMGQQLGFLG